MRHDDVASPPARDTGLTACPQCDALYRRVPLQPGQSLCCQRCGGVVERVPRGGLVNSLALHLTALILLVLANGFPLMSLEIQGRLNTTTLTGAALALYRENMPELAALVLATSVLAPALLILGTLYVLASAVIGRPLPLARALLGWLSHIKPWCMLDVFLLSALIALVKLADIADIVAGPAAYSFVALILVYSTAVSTFEPQLLWSQLRAEDWGR